MDSNIAELMQNQLDSHTGILAADQDFVEFVQDLTPGQPATIDGVYGSSCALAIGSALTLIHTQAAESTVALVVVPRPQDVDKMCDDLRVFLDCSPLPYPLVSSSGTGVQHSDDEVHGQRVHLLKRVANRSGALEIVVASIASLLQPVPSIDQLNAQHVHWRAGSRIDLESTIAWLLANGFHNTSAVQLPGEFSHRGGILDIYSPEWESPVRIELWDDEIESIRQFDLVSQRSLSNLSEISMSSMRSYRKGDAYLTDYFETDDCTLLVEMGAIDLQGREYLKRSAEFEKCHGLRDVIKRFTAQRCLLLNALGPGDLGRVYRFKTESVDRFHGSMEQVRSEIAALPETHEVAIACTTAAEAERLFEVLREDSVVDRNRLTFVLGYLSSGFHWVDQQSVVLSLGEVFRRSEIRRKKSIKHKGKALDSFTDLSSGDLVVHLAHGIGRYRGLELLDKDGHVEEHLVVEFHGGTKVCVPATRIDLVQKYIGGKKSRPPLARIGGKTWVKQKRAAELAVKDMAAEMLELQAARLARPGISFKRDSHWQMEFDASFPYEETPDQLTAIDAIKQDMETPRPMDRLLCGDVGFGKTEVAMRAAFKAIDSGYQVAVMVPTTVLAEQHYISFVQRMAQFPIDVGRLSRFASTAEQKEVLAGLESGGVDIVVGTHRVASKDVKFSNLGLVIIDEEQRFGVEVKERLKSLQSNVELLTLSATPIPRTLHMSLVGVRDISNLETPPEDRLAVETRVVRFQEELIREAIYRELNRGGQIYFIHNRVHDIDQIAAKIQQIAPEARIRIGHGQMHESDLEQVMLDFVQHRCDILLATTIVENGLDIPNANTIFVNEANRYGLADLHQLRGRVGRYKHRAYCYMLIDPNLHITPDAARRLHAIEEYSQMGAGFAIAMRDLEIRGAGNLLGSQQSGHIAAVGYEFYCHLLENAVRHLKKQPPKLAIDVEIELPGEAFLPDDYIPDIRAKIDCYRRLTRLETFEDIEVMRQELTDRFGKLPMPVLRLLELAALKLEATIWQLSVIQLEGGFLSLKYTNPSRIEQLARQTNGALRIADHESAYVTVEEGMDDPDRVLPWVKSVLQLS